MTMKSGTVYSDNDYAVQIGENATFVMDGGTIETTGEHTQALNLRGDCSVTINNGTILGNAYQTAAIAAFGNTTLVINGGFIQGSAMAVAGNGNEISGNVNITVNGGDLIATDGVGMYLPQRDSITTINGGNISGPTGIEIRAADLVVNGGNITATSNTYSVIENGNGTTTKGAAIGVSQHNTKLPIHVIINGGNLKAPVPICDVNPQNNPPESLEKVIIEIFQGDFAATTDEIIDKQDSVPVNPFITGGTYTSDPSTYVVDGYAAVQLAENKYIVTKIHNVTIDSNYADLLSVESDKYPYRATVEVTVNGELPEGKVIVVTDENGNRIKVLGNKFEMPDSDVTISIGDPEEEEEVKGATEDNPKTGSHILAYLSILVLSGLGLLISRILNIRTKKTI